MADPSRRRLSLNPTSKGVAQHANRARFILFGSSRNWRRRRDKPALLERLRLCLQTSCSRHGFSTATINDSKSSTCQLSGIDVRPPEAFAFWRRYSAQVA